MADSMKRRLLAELDSRIQRLEAHQSDPIEASENPYEELNQVLAKVIGNPLIGELRDIKEFVDQL